MAADEKTKIYIGDGYEIIYCVEDVWTGGYNVTVTIRNTGEKAIENWGLSLDQSNHIMNFWNCTVDRSSDNLYYFHNVGWNQDIDPACSVSLGYTAEGDSSLVPIDVTLTGTQAAVSEHDYEIYYNVINKWDNGYVAEIQIKNISDNPIEDWRLSFGTEDEISDIWNAKILERAESTYIIGNAQYNYRIEPNELVSFGFIVTSGYSSISPRDYGLYSVQQKAGDIEDVNGEADDKNENDFADSTIAIDVNLEHFQYNSDVDMYFIGDRFEKICGTISPVSQVESLKYKVSTKNGSVISQDSIEIKENWSISDLQLAYGTNNLTIIAIDKKNKKYKFTVKFYNKNSENAEDMLTNKELVELLVEEDSDLDGLYDYLEAEIMKTDPFCKDSDDNGVMDGDEDFDLDGLSNKEEIMIGTDPLNIDTDNDGIEDPVEINIYKTDPLSEDTDGDGASDLWEMDHEYDPLKQETLFQNSRNISFDGNIEEVRVSIDSCDGKAAQNLNIDVVEEDVFLDENLPGYLGKAIEVETEGSFQKATLAFELSKELLENSAVKPAVYYFNEETQLLEKVADQKISGNVLEASLEHFSKYVLLDSVLYEGILKNRYEKQEADEGSELSTDYVFVLDTSRNEKYTISCIKSALKFCYIDRLKIGDQIAILSNDDSYSLQICQESDKTAVKEYVDSLRISESYDRVCTALYLNAYLGLCFMSKENGGRFYREKSNKNLVIYGATVQNYSGDAEESLAERALNNQIHVYSICTGYSQTLQSLSERTGGVYCYYQDTAAMYRFFEAGIEEDRGRDTDEDGISDYYEKEISAGNLQLGIGVPVGSLDFEDSDTDQDGILDGEEISIEETKENGKEYLYIKIKSNPTKKDTDEDGLMDGYAEAEAADRVLPVDPEPLRVNGKIGLWQRCEEEMKAGMPDSLLHFDTEPIDWSGCEISVWERFQAVAGNMLLNFKRDNYGMAYHAPVIAWQHAGGYNEAYDTIFKTATNHNVRINPDYQYKVSGKEHVIWTWLGDYLNLGSGAEIGLYSDPVYVPQTSLIHWRGAFYTLPMMLQLYNYYSAEHMETIFKWAPEQEQWWITGFNENFNHPVADDMIGIGCLTFTGHMDLYDGLKEKVLGDNDLKHITIFDEEEQKVWLIL